MLCVQGLDKIYHTQGVAFIVVLLPITKMTSTCSHNNIATILPLTLAAIPLFTQLTAGAINRLPKRLIKVGLLYGGKPIQIVTDILIPEAFPNIIQAMHHMLVRLIAYSTVAGILGTGDLEK